MLPLVSLLGCSHTFRATLIPDGKPQDVTCTAKPGTESHKPQPVGVGIDSKILMKDLTAYIYNPAVILDCDY
jgi:hypothetical protein